MTRIVCISDTHDRLGEMEIPEGDVLVHAGDFTGRGTAEQVRGFAEALLELPHEHKVVVAGNHDFLFEREPEFAQELLGPVHYLKDTGVEIESLRFWGSPWQPEFFSWAFNLPRGKALAEKWALIPDDTDVLVTHGPPMGILDRVYDGRRVGCEELREALGRVRPRLHVFGHIHEAYGEERIGETRFINASSCDLSYRATQEPIVIEL